MKRIAFLLFCALSSASFGQQPPSKSSDLKTDGQTTIKMVVTPKASPIPALKYQLLPEVKEQSPGNPAHAYLKCFMEQDRFFNDKDQIALRTKIIEAAPGSIKKGEFEFGGKFVAKRAGIAARLETIDWGILLTLKQDGYLTLLPDVQKMRELARVVTVQARIDVAEGRFDDAIYHLKTLFALTKHFNQHPTLIGSLVGMAIHTQAMLVVEDFVMQPEASNLYWALSFLPTPFVDLQKSFDAESIFIGNFAENLMDPNKAWGKYEIDLAKEKIKEITSFLGLTDKFKNDIDQFIRFRLTDKEWQTQARQFLEKIGYDKATVALYPPEQIVLYFILKKAEISRDEVLKISHLPYVTFEKFYKEFNAISDDDKIIQEVVPSIKKIKVSQSRIDQKIALIRGIELIRIYAAANGGKLPKTLEETGLPVPINPFTGKEIAYELKGETAILRSVSPKGFENVNTYNYTYEITIKK